MKELFHVVLISFLPETSEDQKQSIYDRYQTLAKDCGGKDAGILFWKVEYNLDLRKNVHLVEVAAFSDDSAFQKFRSHPAHKLIAEDLSKLANWQVGDIHCSFLVPVA